MPTPIGHILAGSALAVSSGKPYNSKWFAVFVLFFSVLPDFDVIPGFFTGDVNRYHRLFSHSLVFVTLAGLFGSIILWRFFHYRFKKSAFWLISAGYVHLFMDLLTLDKSAPYGCPLFMPFSDLYLISPVQIFLDLHRASAGHEFFSSLFTRHNFWVIFVEFIILVPVLVLTIRKQIKLNEQAE